MSEVDLSRVAWRKSRRSEGGNGCVEVGVWRKSRRSGSGSDCVEVAVADGAAAVAAHKADSDKLYLMRDSKNPDGPVLAFTPAEWGAFIGGVREGEFDALS